MSALATIATPHGAVVVRKAYAAKQKTYVAVLSGSHAALRHCLPHWKPRSATSTQTQVSPKKSISTVPEAITWISKMLPEFSGKEKQVLVTLADSQKAAEITLISTVRASTLGAYRKQWKRISRHLPGTTLLSSCTRERIQRVINGLAGEGLAASTVRAAITALHRAMAPAIDAGVVSPLAFQRLALPRVVVRTHPPISARQRDVILKTASRFGKDTHLLFALGFLAGLRRNEILSVTWADVDLRAKTLLVRSNETFTTKSGKDRVVPICLPLKEILCRYRRYRVDPNTYVVAPHKELREGSRWAFAKTFTKVAVRAGYPDLTPHDMRRAFATLSVQSGVSIWKLRTWMGHASVTTTEGYTDAARAFDVEIERLIG